jgi:putative tricarboxylic transport membrane protein
LGETVPFLDSGQVRALAVTAAERIETIADVPTLQELGHDVAFANWRGIFAQPQLPTKRKIELIEHFHELRQTNEWNAALQKRGWTPLDLAGNAFANYLLEQEKLLRTTLNKLGFIN